MSEEDFLSRWSRRKREAQESANEFVKPPVGQGDPQPLPPPAASSALAVHEDRQSQPEKDFDLSMLPPIDSITAATDITPFLRSGVPLELTRAALRRAWETDPAIRDFVGLAENAWDFNDPNAMAGFGALDQTPEQVRELVARIVGGARRVAEDGVPSPEPQEGVQPDSDTPLADDAARTALTPIAAAADVTQAAGDTTPATTAALKSGDAASHNTQNNSVKIPRGHGGALPR